MSTSTTAVFLLILLLLLRLLSPYPVADAAATITTTTAIATSKPEQLTSPHPFPDQLPSCVQRWKVASPFHLYTWCAPAWASGSMGSRQASAICLSSKQHSTKGPCTEAQTPHTFSAFSRPHLHSAGHTECQQSCVDKLPATLINTFK